MDPYEGPGNSFVRTLMNPREMTWSKTTAAAAKLIARQNARSKKKLMKHVKEYDEYEFGTQARDLFIRANEALRDYDDETLRQLTTPYAYKVRSCARLAHTHTCAGNALRDSTQYVILALGARDRAAKVCAIPLR
jgi:predicted lipid-binding transport protein (Tim44 family)